MRIISWNVNGLRSNIVDFTTSKNKNLRKISDGSPLDKLIKKYNPDMICFQETRMGPDKYHLFQSEEIKNLFPFQYWSSSKGDGGRSGNKIHQNQAPNQSRPGRPSTTVKSRPRHARYED